MSLLHAHDAHETVAAARAGASVTTGCESIFNRLAVSFSADAGTTTVDNDLRAVVPAALSSDPVSLRLALTDAVADALAGGDTRGPLGYERARAVWSALRATHPSAVSFASRWLPALGEYPHRLPPTGYSVAALVDGWAGAQSVPAHPSRRSDAVALIVKGHRAGLLTAERTERVLSEIAPAFFDAGHADLAAHLVYMAGPGDVVRSPCGAGVCRLLRLSAVV